MAKEDVVRNKETEAALEEVKEQVKANEEDEANRRLVDEARAQMKAALEGGGLQLDKEKLTLDDAFAQIQAEMKKKFSMRLNTDEENNHLASLMQGNRIYESFELVPSTTGDSEVPKNRQTEGLVIRFRNMNSDENAFINQVSLLNGIPLRNGTETVARYDENLRTELCMAVMTSSVNEKIFDPLTISDIYNEVNDAGKTEGSKVSSIASKLGELQRRMSEIRQYLPFGTYATAITAMGAWIEYQRDLVSPMRVSNFSTPPSERS